VYVCVCLSATRRYCIYKKDKQTELIFGTKASFCLKSCPYSITERRVPELIPVLGSQPAGDVSHKPGGRLPLLSARGTMGVNCLPKTVTRQRRDCDVNPGPGLAR